MFHYTKIGYGNIHYTNLEIVWRLNPLSAVVLSPWAPHELHSIRNQNSNLYLYFHLGAITKLKESLGWAIDKFRLKNSLTNIDTTLRFAYRKIDFQGRTYSNFWDLCCSYHQIIAVWNLVWEERDKKGGFVKTNSSVYSVSKGEMLGIIDPGFVSHRIK